MAYVYGGRLRENGKSNRSEAARTGYRSDSPGIFYKFPVQRSSDSGLEALRLPWSERPRNAKIFSSPRRCPPYTDATRTGIFSVLCYRIFPIFVPMDHSVNFQKFSKLLKAIKCFKYHEGSPVIAKTLLSFRVKKASRPPSTHPTCAWLVSSAFYSLTLPRPIS